MSRTAAAGSRAARVPRASAAPRAFSRRRGLRTRHVLVLAGVPLSDDALLSLLEAVPAARALRDGTILQESTWRAVSSHALSSGERVVLKLEAPPPAFQAKNLLFSPGPRVRRELHNLGRLTRLGLSAVEPLACGWVALGPIVERGFLLTRELAGPGSLKSWQPGAAGTPSRPEVLALLGDLLVRLAAAHGEGWAVRTTQAKNLLLQQRGEGRWAAVFCDVPKLRRWPALLRRRVAARDLGLLDKWAQDAFTRTERLRLLDRYLRAMGPPGSDPRDERRRWAALIVGVVERKLHRSAAGRASRSVRRLLKRLHLRKAWPF